MPGSGLLKGAVLGGVVLLVLAVAAPIALVWFVTSVSTAGDGSCRPLTHLQADRDRQDPDAERASALAGEAWYRPGSRQVQNVAAIVAAAQELDLPPRAAVIALATALQESTLLVWASDAVPGSREYPHDAVSPAGDRVALDSVGLFQQRSVGWGPLQQRMDPRGSALAFYRRLVEIPGWEQLPLAEAAQQVQVSALPNAYAGWETTAIRILAAVADLDCSAPITVELTGGTADHGDVGTVVRRATSQVGVPYRWGGGDAGGPTGGGFDCSGLMLYAFGGVGLSLPHNTRAMWATYTNDRPPITDRTQIRPGDMVFLSSNGRASGIHHVGLALGDGRVVHAPRRGEDITIINDVWASAYWSKEFIGAIRLLTPSESPEASDPAESAVADGRRAGATPENGHHGPPQTAPPGPGPVFPALGGLPHPVPRPANSHGFTPFALEEP